MKVGIFSAKPYDQDFLDAANHDGSLEFHYFEPRLGADTTILAGGCASVCAFINDDLSSPVLSALRELGVRAVFLRAAGFNNVDLNAADRLGLKIYRVPAYSPYAVAEHALALIMSLNRKTHRAFARTRDSNFSIEGLMGFDMHGKTAGVIGTGKIGVILAGILRGLGCRVLGYDPYENAEFRAMGAEYVPLEVLWRECQILSLHCPLTPETHHLINETTISAMRPGVMLINTSRGALVDTASVIEGLKSGQIGYLGIDVYEQEADIFYEDLSDEVLQDDMISRLLMFPNVLVTSHQAYFTEEALKNIADTTVQNMRDFLADQSTSNQVHPSDVYGRKPLNPNL